MGLGFLCFSLSVTEEEKGGFFLLAAILKRPGMYVIRDEGKLFYPLIAFLGGIRFSVYLRRNDDPLSKCVYAFEDWLMTRETAEDEQQSFASDFWPRFRAKFASDQEAVAGLQAAYQEFLTTLPEETVEQMSTPLLRFDAIITIHALD